MALTKPGDSGYCDDMPSGLCLRRRVPCTERAALDARDTDLERDKPKASV
jgi:hypothetical protein